GSICNGTRWISGAVLSDVTAIQKNGKKTMIAPHATASMTSQRTCARVMARVSREGDSIEGALLELIASRRPQARSVFDGFSAESPLQQGHRHQRDEHEDRDHRGIAEAEEFERRA